MFSQFSSPFVVVRKSQSIYNDEPQHLRARPGPTARGNPAPFTANFGVGGPGLTIASITSDNVNVKTAA
jgi:hypothetical protein